MLRDRMLDGCIGMLRRRAEDVAVGAERGANLAALLLAAALRTVPALVPDGKAAGALGRGRQPDVIITGLRHFRHLFCALVAIGIEILDHRLAARLVRQKSRHRDCEQQAGASGEKFHGRIQVKSAAREQTGSAHG